MNIKNKVFAAASLLALFVAPAFASAQIVSPTAASGGSTVAALQAEIASLLAELQSLESQLNGDSSSGAWCYNFTGNFGEGNSTGAEVSALQTALAKDGESVGATGAFDDQTAAAVVAFQEKYATEILAPYGLKNGTGYIGVTTRQELNSLFGCNNQNNGNSGSTNNELSVAANQGFFAGSVGAGLNMEMEIGSYILTNDTSEAVSLNTVTVNAGMNANLFTNLQVWITTGSQFGTTQPAAADNSAYTFSNVGSAVEIPVGGSLGINVEASVSASASAGTQNTTSLTAIQATGATSGSSYGIGKSATGQTMTVDTVADLAQQSVTVLYPNGGEVLDDSGAKAGIANITWTSAGIGNSTVGIYLMTNAGDTLKTIVANVSNTGSYSWAYDPTIPNGSYKVAVIPNLGHPEPPFGESAGTFQIVNSPLGTASNPSIIVTAPMAGSGYVTGPNAIGVYWNESGFTPKNMAIYLSGPALAGQSVVTLASLGASTQTYFLGTIPNNVPAGTGYTVSVCDEGTPSPQASAKPLCGNSGSFSIEPPSSTDAPTASLSVSPSTITLGQSATLSWSSTNATNCALTKGGQNISGSSGSWTPTPSTPGTYTYSITCTGSGGTSNPASVTVTVQAAQTAAPTITNIAPSTATFGQTITIYGTGLASANEIWFNSVGIGSGMTVNSNGTSVSMVVPAYLGNPCSFGSNCSAGFPGTYQVAVSNANGKSNTLPLVVTAAPTISQIQGFTATANGNSANLSWSAGTASNGIGVYNIYRSTTSGFTPSSSNRIVQGNVLTYTDSGLPPGTYYYAVALQDYLGNVGPASSEVPVMIAAASPTALGTLIPSDTFVNFSVVQGQSNPPVYNLHITNSSAVSVTYTQSVSNQPSWLNCSYNTQPMTLSAGGVMGTCVAVDATRVNSPGTYTANLVLTGNFTNSPITIPITLTVTAPTAPSQIQGVSATISGSSVTLQWTVPAVGTGQSPLGVFNIYRSTSSSATPGLIAQAGAEGVASGSTLSFTDQNLPGGTYFYTVAAQDTTGSIGPVSNQVSATVGGVGVSNQPSSNLATVEVNMQGLLSQLANILKGL